MGRFGSPRFARERRRARAMDSMAAAWPTTEAFSSFSMLRSLPAVDSVMRSTGTPEIEATVAAMSSAVTSTVFSACSARQALIFSSRAARAASSASRQRAASSKALACTAASFFAWQSAMAASSALKSGGRTAVLRRTREPVSSRASMALSGRRRAGR